MARIQGYVEHSWVIAQYVIFRALTHTLLLFC